MTQTVHRRVWGARRSGAQAARRRRWRGSRGRQGPDCPV